MIFNMSKFNFKFGSRYGSPRTATLVSEEKGEAVFLVQGQSYFTRGGDGMFDFEGGPFYCIGGDFHGRGDISYVVAAPRVVPADQENTETGCLVTVKLNKDAKREIKKWEENRVKVEALKQEVSDWLNNGQ
jgi:hypothetical protein